MHTYGVTLGISKNGVAVAGLNLQDDSKTQAVSESCLQESMTALSLFLDESCVQTPGDELGISK